MDSKRRVEFVEAGFGALVEGPIEPHLRALAEQRPFNLQALFACAARPDESGPHLREALRRAADGEVLPEHEARLLFVGVHILAAHRDAAAFEPLLRLTARPEPELDALLGDAVTQSLPKLAASLFDGEQELLFEAILDRGRDQFVRNSLFDAATFLAWDGRIERADIGALVGRFREERAAADGDHVWVGWLNAIAQLNLTEHLDAARRAWRDGLVDDLTLRPSEFEADVRRARREPDDPGRFALHRLGYVTDIYEEIAWADRPDEDDDPGEFDRDFDEERAAWDGPIRAGSPAINPLRYVGRNDPCPCGSGKKAKKCCLAAGPPTRTPS